MSRYVGAWHLGSGDFLVSRYVGAWHLGSGDARETVEEAEGLEARLDGPARRLGSLGECGHDEELAVRAGSPHEGGRGQVPAGGGGRVPVGPVAVLASLGKREVEGHFS